MGETTQKLDLIRKPLVWRTFQNLIPVYDRFPRNDFDINLVVDGVTEYTHLKAYKYIDLVPLVGGKYVTWEPVDAQMKEILKITYDCSFDLNKILKQKVETTYGDDDSD